MFNSLKTEHPEILSELDTFIDGASMKKTGLHPFVNDDIFSVF